MTVWMVRSASGGRHRQQESPQPGGRPPHQRQGFFASADGFAKDPRHEPERPDIPLMLWDLDDLVQALVENYDHADQVPGFLCGGLLLLGIKCSVSLCRLFTPES